MPGYTIAAIIIGAVIAVLSIPIDLLFIFETEEERSLRFRISWFFGLIGREWDVQSRNPAQKKRKASLSFRVGSLWSILQKGRVMEGVIRFIRDITRVCRVKDIDADIRFGLGDPADTALFFAAVWLPVQFFCSSMPYRVNIEPAFSEEAVIAGRFHLVLRLRPLHIVVPSLRFCFALGIIDLIGVMKQFRWTKPN